MPSDLTLKAMNAVHRTVLTLTRGRVGWTAERYGRSKVWKNTREWTQTAAPDLFTCAEVEIDCTR